MIRKLNRLVPPGINAVPVILLSVAGLILSGFTAFGGFLSEFIHFYGQITELDADGKRVFIADSRMQPLTNFNSEFDVFKIYFVCMALVGVYFFFYHFIGARSIYTMRRLRNPLEFYARCLILPVSFTVFGIALVYVLNLIYIEIYLALVPEECMYPWWDANIWRDLL